MVTLGRRNEREGRVEVLHGVTSGSQVLAARFDNLREGAKASVMAAAVAAVASASASTGVDVEVGEGVASCGSPASRSTTRSSPPW
jgi:hypothetical protein